MEPTGTNKSSEIAPTCKFLVAVFVTHIKDLLQDIIPARKVVIIVAYNLQEIRWRAKMLGLCGDEN